MDKFDEFLKKRSDDENKDFTLPQSFDLKVEETLNSLEYYKKEKWYKDKKIISMVSCFTLVILISLRYILLGSDKSETMEIATKSKATRGINNPEKESYSTEDYGLESNEGVIINEDEVQGLIIKSLSGEAKFKFVNNEEDIKEIIDLINNLYKSEITDQGISEWDFLIQTSGSVNHIIEIKGNLINIDNRYYESDEYISKIIKDIYSSLNYEEKDIQYCNISY